VSIIYDQNLWNMKNSIYTSFPALAPFAILFLLSLGQVDISEKNILGHWSYESTNKEEVKTYKSRNSFPRTKGGIAFLEDGKLIVRQNAGWCGTPPISYRNFDGNWKWINENTIALEYAFWGGTINEEWEIVSVDKNVLNIKSLKYDMRREPFETMKE